MGIRAALDAVSAIQQSLVVPDGTFDWYSGDIGINTVYKYGVPNEAEAPDIPCWFNSWTLAQTIRMPSLLETIYNIRMQLAVYDADQNRAAEIAAAFMDEVLEAFNADITLGGTISHHDIVGSSPTSIQIELDKKYMGIDLVMTVYIKEIVTFS